MFANIYIKINKSVFSKKGFYKPTVVNFSKKNQGTSA